jgi:uncharacterized protein
MKQIRLLVILTIAFIPQSLFGQTEVTITGIPRALKWENTPVKFENNGTKFTIIASEKTDMFRDPNGTSNTDNAPKLLFLPDSNFVLTAAITHSFNSKWDAGAIVLKADSANWVKFCYEKDYTGAKRVVSVVTKNISDDCNSVSLTGNTAYLRMARAGKVITLYCSSDNKNWMLVRHFQFESTKPAKLGFLAQSPTGKSCTVTFSDVRYEVRKIKDPYAGE